MQVLAAEGDPFFLETIEQILKEDGHEVLKAIDAEQLLRRLKSAESAVLVLDARLPELKDPGRAAALAEFLTQSPTPILLLCAGVADLESLGELESALRADDFLHKPFRPDALKERVRRLAQVERESSASEDGGNDRRLHPRLPLEVEVTARTANALLFHPMINISTGGICVQPEERLDRGERLELRFVLPGDGGMVKAEGEVAWCTQVGADRQWLAGIRFSAMAVEDLTRVKRYINALLRVVRPLGPNRMSIVGALRGVSPAVPARTSTI